MTTGIAYEKLGLLYLGKEVDPQTAELGEAPLLYKNKHLTTHAAIIGMTGSGKTGLGIGIIEEAMMDNIPSIIIDPKGDMGNLLLTFPEMKPADFAPWLDPGEAERKGMEFGQYTESVANRWSEGLASWGQPKERLQKLKSRSECTIYTPGSTAGIPVSVLSSFDAPGESVLQDTDTLNSLVNGATTSLLALLDIKGDSIKSREYILLSSIFLYYWRRGEGVSLEELISNVVKPPFEKVGVFGLDTFFSQPDRMELAMALNNVLASPTFSAWMSGDPLDIERILYTVDGKPRTAIFSISHLSEAERMFFVTMLLNQFVGWMRRQQGSSTLKALLYMDEIFGYFPPTANPPSKKPMLLLLKQARAFGVGVVLSTQNPVDLDYKGLSNIGTWFVGRLQTKQDQDKVAEGIAGASDGKLDLKNVRQLLSDMQGRRFLLNSVHLDEPLLFETRWVMSFLKGPISKADISKLMAERKSLSVSKTVETTLSGGSMAGSLMSHPPILSDQIEQLFMLQPMLTDSIKFEPWLLGTSSVRFYNQKRNIDQVKEVVYRLYLGDLRDVDWDNAQVDDVELSSCQEHVPDNCSYYALPGEIESMPHFKGLEKEFSDYLYQTKKLELFKVAALKLESRPDESLAAFKVKVADHLREQKGVAIEKLEQKFKVRRKRIENKIDRALLKVDKEKVDVKSKTTDTLLSIGAAVVGAFFGRKILSAGNISKATTSMRSAGRIAKEKGDVRKAEEMVEKFETELQNLLMELEEHVESLSENFSVDNHSIETFAIKPRRSDIFDQQIKILWEMVPEMS